MFVNQAHSVLSMNKAVNRRAVILMLLILTVSLISLGLKLPSLAGVSSNSGKPKPRPRAVIQNQIKTCKQMVTSLADATVFLPEKNFTVETPQTGTFLSLLPVKNNGCTFLPDHQSRAPPSLA